MSRRWILALCLVFGFVSIAAAEDEFEPWLYFEGDIFPSMIISTATIEWSDGEEEEVGEDEIPILGDKNAYFGVVLSDIEEGSEIRVEISGAGFLKPSVYNVTADQDYEQVIVAPKGVFDFDALHKVRQQRPVNLVMKVTVDEEVLGVQTKTLTLRSINECPWAREVEEGETPEEISWMFAAYVNENHPLIDQILKEALASGLVDSFTGYQSGDPKQVQLQVFSIWHALQRRGIKYSDISTNTPSKGVYSQHVRFLDDSIEATQANCVDGSVLMASILTKIGITAHLVMVPGHCYLAYDTDPNAEDKGIVGLETTMLGNDKITTLEEMQAKVKQIDDAKLKGRIDAGTKKLEAAVKAEYEASSKTFLTALATGSQDLDDKWEKFSEEDNIQFELISIPESREFGIMPISTDRTKK